MNARRRTSLARQRSLLALRDSPRRVRGRGERCAGVEDLHIGEKLLRKYMNVLGVDSASAVSDHPKIRRMASALHANPGDRTLGETPGDERTLPGPACRRRDRVDPRALAAATPVARCGPRRRSSPDRHSGGKGARGDHGHGVLWSNVQGVVSLLQNPFAHPLTAPRDASVFASGFMPRGSATSTCAQSPEQARTRRGLTKEPS